MSARQKVTEIKLANYDSSLSFEYTIDIKPGPSSEMGIKSVLYKKDEEIHNGKAVGVPEDPLNTESFNLLEKGGGTPSFARKQSNCTEQFRYEVCFENITSQEDEYTVTISTELNGRTVTQTVEKFPMGQPEQT